MNEFDIIANYFQQHTHQRRDVIVDSGDDCAVLQVPLGEQLVMSVDALVAGRHFLPDVDPADLGYKCVAVSLSDVAAMGARPAWLMATMTIESADEAWLRRFCEGFFTLLDQYNVALVGGDLTRGPLAITTHATGFVPEGSAITRAGAQPGDLIYVTGTLGDAGLALQLQPGSVVLSDEDVAFIASRLHRPTPRLAAGLAIRGLASAAIDISDGLAGDLQHICWQSGVGARVNVDQLPLSSVLINLPDKPLALQLAVSAGDDYELCFTVPADKRDAVEQLSLDCDVTCIGEITGGDGVRVVNTDGTDVAMNDKGFMHF